MIPGLAEVAKLAPRQVEQAASGVQLFQELGGLTGRLLFALLVVRIVSQRRRLRLVLGPAVFVFSWLYFFAATRSLAFVHVGIFLATMFFNGLHSFWGNYLPRVYPTRLRGTGESFAANIGGRVFGVSAVLITDDTLERNAGKWSWRKTGVLRGSRRFIWAACRTGWQFVIARAEGSATP